LTTHVVLWKWSAGPIVNRSYTAHHVNVAARSVARYCGNVNTRIGCVTDDPEGIECETYPLWSDCDTLTNRTRVELPSCYRRLKLYDPETQRRMDIAPGDRVLSLDLDTVVAGDLAPILRWEGVFVGWALQGVGHPLVYNGSFQLFTAGELADIWYDFDPDSSPDAAREAGFLGSDQAWLSMKLVGREGVRDIPYPLLASYPLHVRRLAVFSARTRLVFFHGSRKPWDIAAQNESPWIKRYWRE
jgi:hypothetical protein